MDKNAEVENYLNKAMVEYSMDLPFDKVHVSVDHEDDPRSVKFLVAYGPEATFIAFRGDRDFGYLGRDKEKLPTSKDLHAEVSELADSFSGPYFKLLEKLYRPGRRIIFCGHRLGGAVAQMVTYEFWKKNEIDKSTKSEENPDPIIAISFGAPQIWDDLHVHDFEANANPHLKRRFLNLSSNEDPLRSILKSGLQAPHQDLESPTFGTQVSAGSRAQGSGTKNYLLSKIWPWKESKPESKFLECYKSAMEDVLALEKYSGPNVRADQPPPKIVVLSPAPKVTSAYRKASDSGSFITIKGSNLLFLREKVKLDGLHPWDTKVQEDEELIILSQAEKTKPEDIDNSISKVVIKTAFGGTSHDVLEGNTEEPLRLLSRIMQTYYILTTTGPFCCPPSDMDEVLAVLDGIIQCVPDSIKDGEKPLSILFREKANIEELNALVQKVTNFLDTSYEIHYHQNKYMIMGLVFGTLLATGLVMIPVGAAALAVAEATTIGAIGLTSTAAVATIGGTSVIAVFLSPKKLMLEKYSDMLKLAIHEASLWNNSTSDLASKLDASEQLLTLTKLEFLLQQEVKRSGSKFDRLMKQVYNLKAKDINSQSHGSYLNDATLESKKNFLKRMDIVAKTVGLYNKKVKNMEFLGLVGEEDSGKSTFIKKAIKSVGAVQHSGMPQTGMDSHTKKVKPYKLQDQFYLVDFPGSNGVEEYADAWVQFTTLPSSCILLLQFKGDIKLEQVQTYKKMQKDLDSKIAVVFNKVDLLYAPKSEKVYTAKYFEDHREKSAEKLGCAEKDVFYVCLKPDPKERLAKLQKVGVLGFEELAYQLGEWLGQHSDSESHQVLLDCAKSPKMKGLPSSLSHTMDETS